MKKFFITVIIALTLLPVFMPRPAHSRGPTDEEKGFASFVDGFVAGVRKELAIPGLALAAVKDGKVLYLKGYGFADENSRAPVDPSKTLFRVGAISQPITAAAVMQLSERGRVNLDEDVNVYLRRWKIPGKFEKPITLRHIMTHTAGFDYKELEMTAPTSSDERAYASKLPKRMPARVDEPGLAYRESGMGYALLGSIVERYSRMGFDAAIRKYIFTPLGMTESAFTIPAENISRLATGYTPGGTAAYEYHYDLPASGMSTTARDMSQFMLAQLSGGAVGRNRILGEMHTGSMMRRHFSPNQMINGAALGYLERPVYGLRTIQRRGATPGYSSFIMMIPEKNFGLFVAANMSEVDFGNIMSLSIVERFFPAPGVMAPPRAPNPADASKTPADVAGFYRTNKISRRTAERISRLTAEQINIITEGAYVLASRVGIAEPPTRWLPADEHGCLFRRVGGDGFYTDDYMFFQRGDDGHVRTLVMGSVDRTYDRLETYESYYCQWVIIAGFAASALLSFMGLFIGNAVNKGKFPWEKGLTSDIELWGIASMFWGAQAIFAGGLLAGTAAYGEEFKTFVPYQVKALFVIPLAAGLLLAWFWFRLFSKLPDPNHHWLEKALIMAVAASAAGYMFFLARWRMLGFMF